MSRSHYLRNGELMGQRDGCRRRGSILVLAAFLLVFVMLLLVLTVDVGYMMAVKTDMQRATDAAALAGAGALVDGTDVAELEAFEFFVRNPVGNRNLAAEDEGWLQRVEALYNQNKDDITIEAGTWDPDGPKPAYGQEDSRFEPTTVMPSAIRVVATQSDSPLFFARVLGQEDFTVTSESIARYQPRDIALVLDFSGSMNDDSELKRISEYGEDVRGTVEDNLLQIYEDLGSPVYGNMQFEPQYISSTNKTTIKNKLGIKNVPYPYPSGSWDDYIDYVKSYNYSPAKANYRKKYGYLTLINYWLEKRPEYSQTPDLWQVSAQPITAVKEATEVFMDYIQEVDTDDRVALAIYNSYSQTALIEHHLTSDFDVIEETVGQRQAGHYDTYTNIGAGIREGVLELQNNGRTGAFKMIVLMTDGKANRPSGTNASQYALNQAAVAAGLHYRIVTISLGSGADTGLMQQIADMTKGIHFNIPGMETVTNYETQLLEVFRKIADARPLILVK